MNDHQRIADALALLEQVDCSKFEGLHAAIPWHKLEPIAFHIVEARRAGYEAAPLIGETLDGKVIHHIGGFGPDGERVDFADNTAKWLKFYEIHRLIKEAKND